MPKRSNPYSEDFIPQSKCYIGVKQFNNNEERLKKVYEKTLQLLYNGAKKMQQDIVQCSVISSTEKKDRMKQLFIAKDGGLSHTGTMAMHNSTTPQNCACKGIGLSNCDFCESILCALCQHQCEACQLWYCSKCSLIGSNGKELCVSCYN